MDKLFYKNLKLFLKDLVVVFPDDDEALQIITTSINLAIIDDTDHKIIKKFYNALIPLEELIINQDISIFSMDPTIYWPLTSYEYKLFFKINNNWSSFNEHSKSTLWEYIQLLFILSKNLNSS